MLKPVSNQTPLAIWGARLLRLIVLRTITLTSLHFFLPDVGHNLGTENVPLPYSKGNSTKNSLSMNSPEEMGREVVK